MRGVELKMGMRMTVLMSRSMVAVLCYYAGYGIGDLLSMWVVGEVFTACSIINDWTAHISLSHGHQ